jgi:hypothetical protein
VALITERPAPTQSGAKRPLLNIKMAIAPPGSKQAQQEGRQAKSIHIQQACEMKDFLKICVTQHTATFKKKITQTHLHYCP